MKGFALLGACCRRGALAGVLAGVLLFAGCAATTPSPTARSHERPLAITPVAPADVTHLTGTAAAEYQTLTIAGPSLAQRAAAASALLHSSHPNALGILAAAFDAGQSAPVRRAVSQAIAGDPNAPPQAMLDVLLSHLDDLHRAVSDDVAAAISRYDSRALVQWLLDAARDDKRPEAARRTAVLALGYHRTRRMAGQLVTMTAADHPLFIREAALTALNTLTGLHPGDDDHQAWAAWWQNARKLSPGQWQAELLSNLEQRQKHTEIERQQAVERLIDSQQALYRQASDQQRPALLAHMLDDAMQPIRSLGMDLALQRLLDDKGFSKPLREALRRRLNDPSPDLRRRATILLRDLADKPAANVIARQLAAGRIHRLGCLRAALLMMRRFPRVEAVDSIYQLLEDKDLRADAAGALASAADAGLLSPAMSRQADTWLHKTLKGVSAPPPEMITLLAKVGGKADWRRIKGWMSSSNAQVKQAAAQAWVDAGRSLTPLAEKAGDPVIGPILITAAAKRGRSGQTLMMMLAHPPTDHQSHSAWARALVAMAGRVPPAIVLDAVGKQVPAPGDVADVFEQMLSAGITAHAPAANQPWPLEVMKLLFCRGRMRLADDDPTEALADLSELAAMKGLDGALRSQVRLGLLTAQLRLGHDNDALKLAKQILDPTHPADLGGNAATTQPMVKKVVATQPSHDPASTQPTKAIAATQPTAQEKAVAKLFLDNAQRQAKSDPAAALSALIHLRSLLSKEVAATLDKQIALLQAHLKKKPASATQASVKHTPPGQ